MPELLWYAQIPNLLITYRKEVLVPNNSTDIFSLDYRVSRLCPLSNILREHVLETGAASVLLQRCGQALLSLVH